MRVLKTPEESRAVYQNVLKTELYDKALGMYRMNAPLGDKAILAGARALQRLEVVGLEPQCLLELLDRNTHWPHGACGRNPAKGENHAPGNGPRVFWFVRSSCWSSAFRLFGAANRLKPELQRLASSNQRPCPAGRSGWVAAGVWEARR